LIVSQVEDWPKVSGAFLRPTRVVAAAAAMLAPALT
jgi:hypothetical protein